MAERSVVPVRSASGDTSIDELRERVSSRFRSVGAAAGALRAEVRAATDPRRIARRHPGWVLVAAAGAGLLVASLARRSRQDSPPAFGRLAGSSEGAARPRGIAMAVGAPIVRGALGLVATVLVRRLARSLKDEARPRPQIVAPRREAAR